ncbi:hypothetical protein [Lactococcus petauri]|uniref:hypothetical protein n=1 Tax=Lactococcus petauri TaxID=1940789 RepID=UPI0022E19C15|nr:hypothetical protein [Lactococcus petauri]
MSKVGKIVVALVSGALLILLVLTAVIFPQNRESVKRLTAIEEKWKEQGQGGIGKYTFLVYYAPSPEEAEGMKANFETHPNTLRVFVEASSRMEAKQEAMNRQHIDEVQILHIVNPDGTSKDGWWPPLRNVN